MVVNKYINKETGQSEDEYLKQKKKETLEKLDNAKFGWFHVRACIVSGIGFFTVNKHELKLKINSK